MKKLFVTLFLFSVLINLNGQTLSELENIGIAQNGLIAVKKINLGGLSITMEHW